MKTGRMRAVPLTMGVMFGLGAMVNGCASVPRDSMQPAVQSVDLRAAWLKSHATAWLSAVPSEAAVEVMARAIGDSRVVMLGELTHGDAKSFLFKTELIKRLHKDHGFEVLVWESGLFDCTVMDEALAGTKDIQTVARMGVFGHWSRSTETIELFEYSRATKGTPRPLIMTGFDLQESGSAGASRWPTYLEWIGESPGLDAAVLARIKHVMADVEKIKDAADPMAEQRRIVMELRQLAAPVADWYASHRDPAISEREFEYRRRCMMNEAAYAEMMTLFEEGMNEKSEEKFASGYNIRERVNADILRWLVDEHFAGKKVMVWAHNVHIAMCKPSGTEVDGPRASMGEILKRALGDRVYTLGVVGFQGKWSWLDNPAIEYAAALPGSLEEAWGATGLDAGFVDLRGCRGAGHWLMQPRQGYLDQQAARPVEVAWPKVYDGVVFFREMTPRVGIPTGKSMSDGSVQIP